MKYAENWGNVEFDFIPSGIFLDAKRREKVLLAKKHPKIFFGRNLYTCIINMMRGVSKKTLTIFFCLERCQIAVCSAYGWLITHTTGVSGREAYSPPPPPPPPPTLFLTAGNVAFPTWKCLRQKVAPRRTCNPKIKMCEPSCSITRHKMKIEMCIMDPQDR